MNTSGSAEALNAANSISLATPTCCSIWRTVMPDCRIPTSQRERPIIFSAPMVRAILAGRKTMTRRLATSPLRKCEPGDLLWVREAWQDYCPIWHGYWCGHGTQAGIEAEHRPVYRADPPEMHLRGPEGKEGSPSKWRPSIHMPRWASRITLEVTSVKIERLQDISYEDCRDEGTICPIHGEVSHVSCSGLRRGFKTLWNSLHGKDAWQANPEVVAISFQRVPRDA
jgi:hypothetical protein